MVTYKEYKTKKGKYWAVKAYLGIDPLTNKQVNIEKRGFKSRKEAKLFIDRKAMEIEKNGIARSKATNFEAVYELWLQTYQLTVKESSLVKLKQKFDNYILPEFGEAEMDKIKPADVQRFANYMCFEKENKHYKEYISNISRLFEFAIRQRLAKTNPVKLITVPKKKADLSEKSIHFFTKDQLKCFLGDAEKNESTKIFTFFHLAAFTGCRQGELLGLQWDAIDLEGKTLTVRQTLTRGENRRLYLEEPKTKKSRRMIPLDDATVAILKKWRRMQRAEWLQIGINTMDAKQLLFTTIDNEPIQLSHPRLWMHRICKRRGLPILSPHALRHTYATMLISEGVDFKTVSDLLGHSTVGMTLDTYAGVYEEKKTAAVNLLANIMK
ncbi:MAG: tyrosine-type recombinase/integrase [Enterococcus avium]